MADKAERLAIALYELCHYDGGWLYATERERNNWRRRAVDTLREYGIVAQDSRGPSIHDVLYVYRIPGKQDRVAWGTNAEAMIYLRMLRAIYLSVSMSTIADDGQFSVPLADVCLSAEAEESLER